MKDLTPIKYKGFMIFFTKQEIAPFTVSAEIRSPDGRSLERTYGYNKEDTYKKCKEIINDYSKKFGVPI